MKKRILIRKLHYRVVPVVAIPFLIVILSGLLLQVKKQIPWVQPVTQKGSQVGQPHLTWPELYSQLESHPDLQVDSWSDIKRLDIRPSKGIAKVQTPGSIEVQMDLHTGEILQIAERNSDWVEALHDGSWFADWVKLWVFLPSGFLVLSLWLSGAMLFILPFYLRAQIRRKNSKTS